MTDQGVLIQRFRNIGVKVSQAATVYQGLRPPALTLFGHKVPPEPTKFFLRKPRLLARTPTGLELWTCYTGPMPIRRLVAVDTSATRVLGKSFYWTLLAIDKYRVWIDADDLAILGEPSADEPDTTVPPAPAS